MTGLVDGGRQRRCRLLGVAVGDQLHGDHRAAAADLADLGVSLGQAVQSVREDSAHGPRARPQVLGFHRLDRRERRRARDRFAAIGAAQPTGVDGVHDLGATGDGRQRHTAGNALGGGDEVGHDALVVTGEPVAGPAEAGLHLVGDEEDVVLAAPIGQRRKETPRRGDETALALDRLDDDCGGVLLADLRMDLVDDVVERLLRTCLLYTSPSPRDRTRYRMPSSA